jgi:hypothetical protein
MVNIQKEYGLMFHRVKHMEFALNLKAWRDRMANNKDRGFDGKRRRPCQNGAKKGLCVSDKPGSMIETSQQKEQGDSRERGISCAIGHELVKRGLSVTLGNCAGNLYPTKKVCRKCGICETFINRYKQPDKKVVIRGEALYSHSPIGYERNIVA